MENIPQQFGKHESRALLEVIGQCGLETAGKLLDLPRLNDEGAVKRIIHEAKRDIPEPDEDKKPFVRNAVGAPDLVFLSEPPPSERFMEAFRKEFTKEIKETSHLRPRNPYEEGDPLDPLAT